jgi:hypothetical protein
LSCGRNHCLEDALGGDGFIADVRHRATAPPQKFLSPRLDHFGRDLDLGFGRASLFRGGVCYI